MDLARGIASSLVGDSEEVHDDGYRSRTTFAGLGVAPALVERWKARHQAPLSRQELTIQDALAGRDVCGKAKTGSGKTLAFACRCSCELLVPGPVHRRLSSSCRRASSPFKSPTCSIFSQDSRQAVLAVYGGTDLDRQTAAAKGTDVVVATPGRLIDLADRKASG